MSRVIQIYKNAYGGLSQAAWVLSLVMLINRSGSMVLPFMSIYTTSHLGYDVRQAGIIMSLFGLGSMGGSFLGGWLTDKIGHFRVQMMSLVVGGSLFFVIAYLENFYFLCAGIFVLSLISECLRPANSSSVAYYARPENITRAFSLNRMAVNLGYSIGPAIGGFIAVVSFKLLFIADGITCITAGIIFYLYFKNRRGNQDALKKQEDLPITMERSPYRDGLFIVFTILCITFAMVFFQIFSTLPLFYRDVYLMSESQIGGLLAINGIMVFSLEMIVVYMLGSKFSLANLIFWGSLLNGLSFIFLNVGHAGIILIGAMFILSIAEILAMPFMATITVQRSTPSSRGAYLGMYSFSFSTAMVLAPYLGTRIISNYGFEQLWWACGGLSIFSAFGFLYVVKKIQMQAKETSGDIFH